MKTVGDIMSTEVLTVEPGATVAEAATLMGSRHVGSAMVLKDGKLAGIFTERDIVRALGSHFDAAGDTVEHWMTTDPRTVGRDMNENDALDLMLAGGFRHLPVVEEAQLLGVVSMRDVSHHASDT